jgi:hypothetical protein
MIFIFSEAVRLTNRPPRHAGQTHSEYPVLECDLGDDFLEFLVLASLVYFF